MDFDMSEALASFTSGFGPSGGGPSMMINLSGRCATTKLIQCTQFGTYMCDVSRKFEKDPRDVPDLTKEDFLARKKVVEQVAEWDNPKKLRAIPKDEWVPILYAYEVVKSSAKRNRDWGQLVFTDLTLTRFLIVLCMGEESCKCGNPYHHDYDTLTKYHADRWASLVKYVYRGEPNFKWVRATYTTFNSGLHYDFLNSVDPPAEGQQVHPPIFHVTADDFVPSLLDSELDQIDNLMTQSGEKTSKELRELVRGKKEDRPNMTQTWVAGNIKNPRQCNFCRKIGMQTMPQCGKCKLVRYCDTKCQKAAWPMHKNVCKRTNMKA